MVGFELITKEDKISAGLEKGVILIILTKVVTDEIDSVDLDFVGGAKDQHIVWHKSTLKLDDEVTIKVKDISENSNPIEIKTRNDGRLKAFYELQKRLKEKGLI